MQQEVEELSFDPCDGGAQDEYERGVMDIEQESIKNSYIDWEIRYAELTAHRTA